MKKLNLLQIHNIIRNDDHPDGRHYILPTGEEYPSVTNILSKMSDHSYLEEWRKRIGEKEADKITKFSAWRGENLHKSCEEYILGELDQRKMNIAIKDVFRKIKPIIDEYINTIYGIELPLFSHKLKTAGSSDLVAGFGRYKAVIDYKNSRSIKEKEDIKNYFFQTTAYGICLEEMYSFTPDIIVVLIATDGVEKCVSYIEPFKKYKEETIELFKTFHSR